MSKKGNVTMGQRLAETADGLQDRIRYYGESPEGREEVRQTVYQAGRVISGAANLAWTIAKSAAGCVAARADAYYQASQKAKKGQYKEAGKDIAEMQMNRMKGTAKAAVRMAGTAYHGVEAVCTKDTEAARKFRHGVRNCAVIGGTALLASEAVDAVFDTGEDGDGIAPAEDNAADIPDADGAEGLLPTMDVEDLPGVEDGILLDASPEHLEQIAEAGEYQGTQHLYEVVRSQDARMAFLAEHDLERIPDGWEIHHVVPLSEGGADTPDNMILIKAEDHDWITRQHRLFYGWPGPEYWSQS